MTQFYCINTPVMLSRVEFGTYDGWWAWLVEHQ